MQGKCVRQIGSEQVLLSLFLIGRACLFLCGKSHRLSAVRFVLYSAGKDCPTYLFLNFFVYASQRLADIIKILHLLKRSFSEGIRAFVGAPLKENEVAEPDAHLHELCGSSGI